MLILGHFVLHETVGAHRIGACAVGFCGTLLVIQPNFAAVGWPALLPLGVAVIFALFMLVTRQIAKQVDAVHLQAVSGIPAIVTSGAAVAFDELTNPDGLNGSPSISQRNPVVVAVISAIGKTANPVPTGTRNAAPASGQRKQHSVFERRINGMSGFFAKTLNAAKE